MAIKSKLSYILKTFLHIWMERKMYKEYVKVHYTYILCMYTILVFI